AICDLGTGNPTNFADSLSVIAELIGKAINSLCLQAPPMTCDPDGLANDGTCQAGKTCCPQNQACNREPSLAGPDLEYFVCSGFTDRVEVEETDAMGNATRRRLEEGVDYTTSLESTGCVSTTGSPV